MMLYRDIPVGAVIVTRGKKDLGSVRHVDLLIKREGYTCWWFHMLDGEEDGIHGGSHVSTLMHEPNEETLPHEYVLLPDGSEA